MPGGPFPVFRFFSYSSSLPPPGDLPCSSSRKVLFWLWDSCDYRGFSIHDWILALQIPSSSHSQSLLALCLWWLDLFNKILFYIYINHLFPMECYSSFHKVRNEGIIIVSILYKNTVLLNNTNWHWLDLYFFFFFFWSKAILSAKTLKGSDGWWELNLSQVGINWHGPFCLGYYCSRVLVRENGYHAAFFRCWFF